MRKILAVAAAAAFAGTFFTGVSHANDPCVRADQGNPKYVTNGPWGPIYAPGTVVVDLDPQGCITLVTQYLP